MTRAPDAWDILSVRPILVAALLILASRAAADDIGPPPETCPPGALGHSEHAGEWCVPTECATDADCTEAGLRRQGFHYPPDGPLTCREVALCVVEEQYTLGGLRPDPAPTATRRIARGACIDGVCPAGGECRAARRCIATEPPSAPVAQTDGDDGGGCAVGRSGGATPTWLAALLLALTLRR